MKKIILHERLQRTVGKLAKKIPTKDDMVYLGVLDGCIPFLADLMMHTDKKIEIRTVRVNSYSGKNQGIIKNINFDYPLEVFNNKEVVIVDDIFDSGNTIRAITKKISPYTSKIYWCCLLRRRGASMDKERLIPGSIAIPDKAFVIGYGLDYCGRHRNLKDIYRLEE